VANDTDARRVAQADGHCYNQRRMYSRVSRAYIIVPAIYIVIIVGLLLLQFAGGERITRTVGQLVLQATRAPTTEDGQSSVRAVELTFNGVEFLFSEDSGASVTRNGTTVLLAVERYTLSEEGFSIHFAGGFQLNAVTTSEPVRELQLRLRTPDASDGISEIAIPFALTGESELSDRSTASFAFIENGVDGFYLTVPPGAEIDLQTRAIRLTPASAGDAIRYVEAVEGDPAQVSAWFEDPATTISDAQIATIIEQYLDSAYRGWDAGRYNQAALTWDREDAPAAFSEAALTAYLAEAWERGSYERAFAEMRRATDLHPDALGLLSSVYLGNLSEVHAQQLAADGARAGALTGQIEAGDPTVFRDPQLLRFAATRGSEELYSGVLALLASIDPRTVDAHTLVGLAANLFLLQAPDGRAAEIAGRLGPLVQQSLFATVVRTGNGFFLQSSPGQIDVRLSLIAGRALEAYGRSTETARVVRAGRNLIASALAQADVNGVLPSALLLRGEQAEPSGGGLYPEEVYHLLDPAPAYPRVRSLYRQLGSGHWTYTAVPVQIAQLNEQQWEFIIEYPRLRTHYLIFFGIPEFTEMELFGQVWRNAPDFEIYSKGRQYDPDTQALLIKYYDDSTRGRIVLFY
jgi:hypothetical protein